MLKTAKNILSAGDEREVVDFAIEVGRQIAFLTSELRQVKEWLRGRAKVLCGQKEGSKSSVKLRGNLGVASVVFIPPAASPKKGMQLLDLKATLRPEVYRSLFVERTVVELSDDFAQKYASLNLAEKAVVSNYVGVVEPTARVNLPT